MIERIVALMERKQITATQLENEIDIYRGTISNWKKGKTKPSLEAIVNIAKYFSVSCDYILTGEEFHKVQSESNCFIDFVMRNLDNLNDDGLKKCAEYISDLAGNPKYQDKDIFEPISCPAEDSLDVAPDSITKEIVG